MPVPLADALRPHVAGLPSARDVLDGFRRHELLTRATALAFNALIALIPLSLFAAALAGMLSLQEAWTNNLAPDIARHVSHPSFQVLDRAVRNVLGHQRLFWVSGGLALAVWEISGGVRGLMDALDAIYGTRARRTLRQRLFTSAWLGAAWGALVLATVVVVRFGPLVLHHPGPVVAFATGVVRYLLAAALLTLGVGLLVHHAPARPQPLGWVTFGSALVVVAWLVTWSAYGFYVTQIASYGSIFGAFAVVFVLMTVLFLSAVVLLGGTLVDALTRDGAARRRRAA